MNLLRRIAPSFVVIVGIVAMVVVSMIGLGGPAILLLPLVLVIVGVASYRRSGSLEVGWSGSGAVGAATPVGAGGAEGDWSPAPSGTGRGSVATSLLRTECRELVASPWFHVGIALWLVVIVVFGLLFNEDVERSWREFFLITSLMCHPFAAFAIVAAHRNRTRSRRDGCDELFDACPADANARTLGHLGTAWIAAAVNIAFVVVLTALIVIRNQHEYGPWGGYVVAALLTCGVLGAGAIALGVTLGRWAPWALAPFVAVVLVGVASSQINPIGDPAFATDRLLATFVATTGVDTIFLPLLWWERLAWLTAISVVVAALGLLGGRTTGRVVAVLATSGVVALVAGLLVVRPATGRADRIADLVADPLAGSTCFVADPAVQVCAYEGYEMLASGAAEALAPVAAAVPSGVLRDVLFLTFYERDPHELTAETQAELEGREVRVPDGALRLRYNVHPENFEALRLRLAARAVGLPTEVVSADPVVPTPVDGQARGVVVLWLAGQGLDAEGRRGLVDGGDPGQVDEGGTRAGVWPALCHEEDAVLQWSPTDLAAARTLFGLPDERVRTVLHDRWDQLVAPGTTTDDLLVALGVAPLGEPAPIPPQEVSCA